MGVSTRYAVRSVVRNIRRTLLSVIGIGVGCALALVMEGINRGKAELLVRMTVNSGVGHVKVVPAGWTERRDVRLRLADWERARTEAGRLPDAQVVASHARAQVLLAMGSRVVPLEMLGVEPSVEPALNLYARRLSHGRYLAPGERGTAVIGQAVADRLRVEVEDEVMATAVGQGGAIASTMLRIVGIVSTGSEDVDAGICHVPFDEVGRLTGLPGASDVAVLIGDWRRTDAVRASLAVRLPAGDLAVTWGEAAPELRGHFDQDTATSRVVSVIILLIVLLGVASAQLAGVLERRRELAVLAAVGMRGWAMAQLVVQEALALGALGGVAGLALGVPLTWQLARHGIDFGRLGGIASEGLIMEPVIYGDFGSWIVGYTFLVAIVATLVASLYPAWYAARTDPATALRVAP